ncbi:hypothetical protein GUJ93_ZPchr0001g31855 [Zizania palustris]|uniref:Peptidase A1 domain-containing protein n=1 Tax=Zizania palustris TaxID=103762 RepID=A0A8J5RPV2_ZIZPA|nr:hypothetical protein GUJ93_ZPchr0001g31855 [Zizania palustris]
MSPPVVVPLLLLLLLSASPRTVLCRRHHVSPARAATETLDVAASLSRARAAVSTDAVSLHQSAAAAGVDGGAGRHGSKGGMALRLHSRDFLPEEKGRHVSYKSLVLARLRRDSARAAAVSARATLAADGVTRAELMPVNVTAFEASAAEIQGPVVSGVGQGSGEYFSRVGVGSPARQLYMVLDTGSDVTWVQCQPCADCYQQSDPVFDPSLSASYASVGCDSPRCHDLDAAACRNSTGACLYEVAYGDGSYTVGDFATETLTLGDSSPVSNVAIGCGHDNEGLFVGAAGLLALGGGPLSFPSQISATSFSYCLVDRDSPSASTLQFGDSAGADSDVVTAPLIRSPRTSTFYYVGLSGLSVGGEVLSIPSSAFAMDSTGAGGVIVDSGTAVTRLQTPAYAALRDAFVRGTQSLPRTSGVSLFDTCYDLSDRTSVEVPAVALRFDGGGELRLPAKNYLIPVDGAGTYCLAFAPTNAAVSIIGNVQQQGTRVGFDTAKATVGFSSSKC